MCLIETLGNFPMSKPGCKGTGKCPQCSRSCFDFDLSRLLDSVFDIGAPWFSAWPNDVNSCTCSIFPLGPCACFKGRSTRRDYRVCAETSPILDGFFILYFLLQMELNHNQQHIFFDYQRLTMWNATFLNLFSPILFWLVGHAYLICFYSPLMILQVGRWVIAPFVVVGRLSGVSPTITGVGTHLLTERSHQVPIPLVFLCFLE